MSALKGIETAQLNHVFFVFEKRSNPVSALKGIETYFFNFNCRPFPLGSNPVSALKGIETLLLKTFAMAKRTFKPSVSPERD